ncbi:MAG: diguanylate cyclase [Chloroflexi bacterium]|nr:diguanylate cyclase [Chloroflexota bacterium]
MLTTRKDSPVLEGTPTLGAAPQDDKYVPAAVYSAAQALLRVARTDEAAQVLVRLVRDLGGHAVPESIADQETLPIDISLGEGEPVYPSAPEGSATHWLLTTYIEGAVADAQAAIALVRRAERLAADAGIDETSALPDHQTMSRLVSRLREGDAIVALDLDWIRVVGTDQEFSDRDLLRSLGKTLRQATRATEYCGRFSGGEFVVLMANPTELGGTRMLERLRERWANAAHPQELTFSAGIAVVGEQGWRTAVQAADRALRRAQESGDSWETARPDDY